MHKLNKDILEASKKALSKLFPVKDDSGNELELIEFLDPDSVPGEDISTYLSAINNKEDLTYPLKAKVKMNGKETVITVADIPSVNPDTNETVLSGNAYSTNTVMKTRLGVYFQNDEEDGAEAQFNVSGSKNFKIKLDAERRLMLFRVFTKNFSALSILSELGIEEDAMRKYWGDEIFEATKKYSEKKSQNELESFFNEIGIVKDEETETDIDCIKKLKVDPKSTKITTGRETSNLDEHLLFETTKKIINIYKNNEKVIPKSRMVFKTFSTTPEFIYKRITKKIPELKMRLKRTLTKLSDEKSKVNASEVIDKDEINKVVLSFYKTSNSSDLGTRLNPISLESQRSKVTVIGEGTITDKELLNLEAKSLQDDSFGFIDPVHTPESNAGVILHMNYGVELNDEGLLTQDFLNVKTKKHVKLTNYDTFDKRITFPEFWDGNKIIPNSEGEVPCIYKSERDFCKANEVDFVLDDPDKMFSEVTNLLPMLQHINATRTYMGANQSEQAVSLKNPEKPLVYTEFTKKTGKGFLIKAPRNCIVKSVEKNKVVVKFEDGKPEETIIIPEPSKLGLGSAIIYTIKVKPGDRLKEGDVIAETNFHKDGEFAHGTNLNVAYMPWKGFNTDDGIVITESASKKLTSVHTDYYEFDNTQDYELDAAKYKNLFPVNITTENFSKLDKEGVVKKGERVKKGEVLIAAIRKKTATEEDRELSKFGKALGMQLKDGAVVYSKDDVGEVISVTKQPNYIRIVVKYDKAAKVGDKLTGRAGNKGIISEIIPDKEAPVNAKGERVDIFLNPIGVPSRINPAQTIELALTKNNQGRTLIKNFKDDVLVKSKKIGTKENLFSPEFGEIENVPFGKEYILKLVHIVDKKESGRSIDGYTSDKTPTKGKGKGGQSIDPGSMYALLTHGCNNLIQEMVTSKSEENIDMWKAIANGETLPAPKETFVFGKLLNIFNAMGINTERVGSTINFFPMTEKQITDRAKFEITQPTLLKASDGMPDKNGLFDYKLGGTKGEAWGKVSLEIPVINPLFKKNIKLFVDQEGMKNEEIYEKLKSINVENEIKEIKRNKEKGTYTSVNSRDKANKKLKLLYGLKAADVGADAWMMKTLPVLPPIFRPVTTDKRNGLTIAQDFNNLYRDVIALNNTLKEKEKFTKRDDVRIQEKIDELFNGKTNDSGKEFKGLLKYVQGDQPKKGFFQTKVVKKRQDYSGRSTITPDPKLGPSEIGLPAKVGFKIFEPFIIKELKNKGYKLPEIEEAIENKTELAYNALKEVSSKRPIVFNRAPSLHKFSVMGAIPKIHKGKDLKVNPMYAELFNFDFDGDCSINSMVCRFLKPEIKLDKTENEWYTSIMEVVGMPFEGSSKIRYVYGLVNLEEFPKGKLLEEKGNKKIYSVPEGIEVLTVWNGEERWLKPESFHIHTDLNMLDVKTSSSRSIQCSDDHSLVTVDENLDYKRDKAELGMTIPRLKKSLRDENYNLLKRIPIEKKEESKYVFCKNDFELDYDFGYFIGVYVGDGWVSTTNGKNNVCLASEASFIPNKIKEIISNYFVGELDICSVPSPHIFEGKESYCEKHTWSSKTFCSFLEKHINKGAENKHLPLFWMHTEDKFRWGMLSGLIDTDGSVTVTKSKGKNKNGIHITYNTNSKRLAYEVVGLANSLGLTATAVPTQTPKGKDHWVVTFSHDSIMLMQRRLLLQTPGKAKALSKLDLSTSRYETRKYTPKLSKERLVELRKAIGSPGFKNAKTGEIYPGLTESDVRRIKEIKCLNVTVNKFEKTNSALTLETAKKIFDLNLDIFKEEFWLKWKNMVLDEKIEWDVITEINPLPHITEAYDLTIPPAYTMVTESGYVIYDSMGVHVPIHEKAVEDVKKILLNKNIFNDAYNERVMPTIMHEQISGLWIATKKIDEKKEPIRIGNMEEVVRIFKNSPLKYKPDQPVIVSSENEGKPTSYGRVLVNSCFPRNIRNYKVEFSKSNIKRLITQMANQVAPEIVTENMNFLKEIGNFFATKYPISLGVEDLFDTRKQKDETMKSVGNKDFEKLVKSVFEFNKKNKEDLEGKTNYLTLSSIGAKGNELQTQQIIGMPGFVIGTDGKVSKNFIRNSFGEGLRASEYWSTIPGSRLGMIGRAEATALPGALAKTLINASSDGYIYEKDCKTSKGKEFDIDSQECIKRLLATPQAGLAKDTVVTKEIIDSIKKKYPNIKKINLRSPETCESAEGICSKCFGVNNYGEFFPVGHQTGMMVSQSMSEPLTQGTMNAFHTGGLATEKDLEKKENDYIPTGFDRIKQTFGLSDSRRGQGVLAEENGKVEKINKTSFGEHEITINGKKYFIPKTRKPIVKVGDEVKKGDMITDGLPNMQKKFELVPLDKFRDELKEDIKKSIGGNFSDRALGVMTKSLTNIAEIKNPGNNIGMVEGDVIRLDIAENINKTGIRRVPLNKLVIGEVLAEDVKNIPLKAGTKITEEIFNKLKLYNAGDIKIKADKIEFKPMLKGVVMLPHLKYEDPFMRMNYNRIPRAIEEAASYAQSSTTNTMLAIPRLVQGVNFNSFIEEKNKE